MLSRIQASEDDDVRRPEQRNRVEHEDLRTSGGPLDNAHISVVLVDNTCILRRDFRIKFVPDRLINCGTVTVNTRS